MLLLKTQSFLQALSSISLGGILKAILGYIFLAIDSVVYFFVSQGFKMYIALAQFKLFDENVFKDLINRTYIVIGVIALFIVAYALINSIINPDNASKGDKSLSKIVKNFIFAIIGIAIVPTVFNYFYYFQRVVLCNNLIPKILLAQKGDDSQADLLNDDKIGTQFATYLFQSFFYPKSIENMNMTDVDNDGDLLKSEAAKVEVGYIGEAFDFEESVNAEKFKQYDKDNTGKYNLQMAYEAAMDGEMFFTAFRIFLLGGNGFANSVLNNTVNYMIIVSTIAGVYCAYVLASLCIDMAIRAVKLGYLELIAPLPIMTLIIPGKDGVFKAWIKKTGSCAFEVFTRLFIVSFVIYLIRTIPHLFTATSFSYSGCTTSFWIITALLIRALVYCGLLTFLKQAPKFLSEATGIKSDGFKLGIADKLGEMALIGGAAKNGVRAAQGAATGALGGLATGLGNGLGKNRKINLKSAVMQGATQGFKGKGNQFSKQRESTFQSIGEYKDKTQGLFGGESKISKFINDHKKDVENDYGEIANSKKYNGQNDVHYQDLKNNFTDDKVDKRMEDFKQSDIYKQAENYAQERMNALGTTSKEVHDRELANYLTNAKSYTTDENLKRKITQFENDAEVSSNRKNYYEAKDDYNKSLSDLNQAKLNLTDTRKKLNSKAKEITLKESEIKTENTNLENLDTTLSSSKNELDTSKLELDNAKLKLDNASAKKQQLTVDLNNQEINLRNAAKEMFNIVGNRVNLHKPDLEKCSVQELNDYINDCSLEIQNDPMTQEMIDKINLINNSQTDYQTLKKEYDDSENEYNSAQSDYSSKTSDYNSKESDYQTVYNQVEQQKKKVENLVNENKALHSQEEQLKSDEQKYQSLAQRLHHENENAKNNLSKQETIYVDSVDKGTEAIYNGDASIHYNGSDDLKTFDNEIINAIKNKDIDLAKELIRQKKTQEEYRGAKKGITDMSKPIDYEKELYNYFKKQKKDE